MEYLIPLLAGLLIGWILGILTVIKFIRFIIKYLTK
jgi:xanthosine utilization system XapX-like protein